LQQRSYGFNLSATESLKIIGQNLETIDMLQEACEAEERVQKQDIGQLEAFDFNKRKLVIGQWIDVKDTIQQWVC
jgi:hypothetical protein